VKAARQLLETLDGARPAPARAASRSWAATKTARS